MPNIRNSNDLDYEYLETTHRDKIYEEYHPTKIPARRYENIKISKDALTFKLIDKDQKDLVSLINGVKTTYHKNEYFEIQWTFSKFPQRGNLTYLFDLIIKDLGYKIICDKNHTSPGSKEFWLALIRKKRFEIYRYDIKSNYKRKASNYKDFEIWGAKELEQDELIKELSKFENYIGLQEIDDNFESEYQDELLQSFESNINEIITPIEQIQVLIDNQKKKIESKENIRLIAQKM